MSTTAQQHLNGVDIDHPVRHHRRGAPAARGRAVPVPHGQRVGLRHPLAAAASPASSAPARSTSTSGDTVIEADHPAVLVGTDQGPTPAELLLNALASCLMAGLGNIAVARGVELHGVRCRSRATSTCAASSGSTRPCATGSATSGSPSRSTATPTPRQWRRWCRQSQARSAVFDVLTHGTKVDVEVARR